MFCDMCKKLAFIRVMVSTNRWLCATCWNEVVRRSAVNTDDQPTDEGE